MREILSFHKGFFLHYEVKEFLLHDCMFKPDADSAETFIPNNDPTSSVQALEGRVPNYLLLVSLLEHLCSLYESDSEKSKKIFNGRTVFSFILTHFELSWIAVIIVENL